MPAFADTNTQLSTDWQIVGTPLGDTLDGGIAYGGFVVKYTELYGGLGNDFYLIDGSTTANTDRVVELANGGIDTVTLVNTWFGFSGYWATTATYVMPDNIENLNVMGADFLVQSTSLVAPFTNFIIDKTFIDVSIYGNALGNNIVTGCGNDTIYGGLGNDTMAGGTGDDTYYVDATTDVIIESALPGSGSASLPGGVAGILGGAIDTVYSIASYTLATGLERLYLDHAGGNINGTGNAQANSIYGNSGNNNLQGLGGNDNIYGGGGKDTIAGGDGDDLIVNSNSYAANSVVSYTRAYFDAPLGNGSVAGAAAPSNIDGGAGNDTIWGGAGDTVLGGAGNDIIYGDFANFSAEKGSLSGGDGNDVFMNFGKADSLAGGGGIDTAFINFDTSTVVGGAVTVNYTLAADIERGILSSINAANTNDTLIGNALDNYLQGNAGNDSLVGGAGQDVLDGGLGADTMIGGDGADSFMVDNIGDVVLETTVVGGDTVHFFGGASFTSYTLGANVENLVLMGGSYVPTTVVGSANAFNGKGNALNNLILGNANANLLEGAAGNDTLNGGVGADTLIGGSGDDVYFVDNGNDVIQELADFVTTVGVPTTVKGGIDNVFLVNDPATAGLPTFFSGTGYVMARNVENLDASAITSAGSTLVGGFNFSIRGNESANKIVGSRLNDTIVGGAGNDSMDGGLGNDTYYVTDSGDIATETLVGAPGGTADTIIYRATATTYTMGANIENLIMQGGSGTIIGNLVDNVITGNGADNVIDGGAGHDTLYGNFGNDNLKGGAGNDTLDGGVGNDTLDGGGDNDTYYVDILSDKIVDSAGIDTVRTNLSNYDLSALIVGGGNSGLTPGAGGAIENLYYSYWNGTAWVAGTGSFNATGNALNNSITGGGASDILAGYAGNDTLDGGAGADLMKGGTGDDTFYVDSAGDVILEDSSATGGKDTVISKLSFDLNSTVTGGSIIFASGQKGLVENLTLASTVNGGGTLATTTIMGNELANTLTGNELNNLINGGAGRNTVTGALATSVSGGADTMVGGDGNDIYFVDDIGDRITELSSAPSTVAGALFSAAAGNADEIYATLADGSSFSMLANALNVERLHILDNSDAVKGTADTVNVIGNASDNIIWGGKGANNIDGGLGSDIITGGAGNDTLLGGDGDDVLDGDGLYQDSYMGAWITASGGADSMSGGNGNDIFYVDKGDGLGTTTVAGGEDTVAGGAGSDTVKLVGNSITEYSLNLDVENLDVSGLSSTLTGAGDNGRMFANALNNTMTGRSGYGAFNNKLLGGDGNDTFYLAPKTGDFDTVHGGSNDLSTGDTSKADVLYAKPDASAGAVSATLHASGIEAVVLDVSNNANGFTWATDLGTETFANAPFALSNFTQTPTTVPGGIAPTVTITGGVTGGQATSSDITGITVAGNITLTGLGGGDTVLNTTGPTYVLANYNQNNSLAVTTTLTLDPTIAPLATDSLRVVLDNHKSGGLASAGVEKLFIVSTGDVLNNGSGFNGLDVSFVTKSAGGMADIDVTGDSSLQLRALASGGNINLHDFAAQTLNLNSAGATINLNLNNVETSLTSNATLTDLQLTVTPSTIGGIGSVIGTGSLNAATVLTLAATSTGNLTINNFQGGTLNLDGSGDVRINVASTASALAVTATDGDLNFNVGSAQNDSYAFGTSLDSNDIVTDAGGATDSLSATLDGLDVFSGQLRLSGIETLNFITSGASGLVDAQFISVANLMNVTVAGGTSLTVQNLDVATVAGGASTGDLAVYMNSLRNHTITGGNGDDTISGGDLNDTINIGTGINWVAGNGGNDTIGGTLSSADTIDGGDGSDTLVYADSSTFSDDLSNVSNIETLTLTNTTTSAAETTVDALVAGGVVLTVNASSLTTGALTWNGSAESSTVVGGNGVGSFSVTGGAVADRITGGDGNDSIVGGNGTDTVAGGGGNDTITMRVTAGNTDEIDAGLGTDTLVLSLAATALVTTDLTAGDQFVDGTDLATQTGFENLDASAMTAFGVVATAVATGSIIIGSAQADTITGGIGNDSLAGGIGTDTIDGGNGNDTIEGGTGIDTITGGAGDDLILWDKATADDIDAGTGTDTLKLVTTATTAMTVDLSQAVDQVTTSGTNQTGFENLDASFLTAALTATAAATGSSIIGGSGADTIISGAGADTLTGNGGADIFRFAAQLAPGNVDTITDFTSGTDDIELDHLVFESLTTRSTGATISNAEFAAGANLTSSATEGTVLIYNSTTGALYYDADANGAGAGELIFVLGNAPTLVASDIGII